jgi:hypothetical protein
LVRRILLALAHPALSLSLVSCTPFKEDPIVHAGPCETATLQSGPPATLNAGDAGSNCDVSKPFGAPQPVNVCGAVAGLPISGLRLSQDSLTGYFAANDMPNFGGYNRLYSAPRTGVGWFGSFVSLAGTELNPTDYVTDPAIDADGLRIFFGWAPQGARQHIAYSTRATSLDPFVYQGLAPVVNDPGADPSSDDSNPYLGAGDDGLYFASNRVAANNHDILQSTWNGLSFGAPTAIPELNTSSEDRNPVVTPDALTLFFASDRPDADASGKLDIWLATRRARGEKFSTPTIVSELNTPDDDAPTFVTSDGCTLYFSRSSSDLSPSNLEYFAQRPARP